MEDVTYTRKEVAAINNAYSICCWLADEAGHSMRYRLEQAVRIERKERSSVTVAKALVVAEFCKGLYQNPKAFDIAFLAEGCAMAVLVGAAARNVDPKRAKGFGLDAAAAQAREAHDAYLHRIIARPVGI
jgi:hypothetical protein